jgi:hypothetical protein
MKNATHFFQASKPTCPNPNSITTNLYDLVAAISDIVGVGEERLVADTVLHLIETGRMKFVCRARIHRRTRGPTALA